MNTRHLSNKAIRQFVLIIIYMLLCISLLHAQVGIDVASPNASAVLDLNTPAKNKGLLVPKVNTTDWEGQITPVDGLLVYDENQTMFYHYDGALSKWQAVNPFSYRKGSNAVDEDHFIIDIGKSVVIGTVATPTERFEVGGNMRVTGTAPATGNIVATNNITAGGQFIGHGTIPIGGIIMWSGSPTAVPAGWALCNNQIANGIQTPDLSGRFIVGVGTSSNGPTNYAVNATGGEETHTLTLAEMPSHDHGGSTSTNGSHSHDYSRPNGAEGYAALYNSNDEVFKWDERGDYSTTTTGAHSHTITAQGGGTPHENRPPYYVLAFIMRVQ